MTKHLKCILTFLILMVNGLISGAIVPAFAAESLPLCESPTLDEQFNLKIPCAGVSGVQYAAELEFVKDQGYWQLKDAHPDSSCQLSMESNQLRDC